ncbi:bifunctional diaminohydroxyphosphoribosylaminopyrimidine deaminase/5-amino-6-(5-phosphoribosylamino)uracil reductase RibD [Corynebacterium lubricantis]|uniref:bifunctional diaminohydroxyphosphoribosylaminopyrimidine deaminase/5-amino-6-(5-phosphoribosylamino)uracil reductase RibD n=1 Tax=Corynebacterium lubricantis TaxID=541095 RepID=UPI000380F282|nr:bifunctional diaminohydroxyphosphoribosylaminopyrimidine deaminase/5-amino-6-(5-phosphoribosylamino)uracil reductase RibD [Corynebacterium lubricantis]
MLSSSDAIAAGHAVRGTTSPNPPVGCALYDDAGRLITTGGTEPAGGAHAEIVALRAAGDQARGATAVVTLEPCNHTGRTGPCSHALAEAGVARVVYLTADPNPLAVGGAQYLREQGVEVEFRPTEVADLQPWLTALELERPHVTVKYAASLDGFTAAPDGTSQWITGATAREAVHVDRTKRDAIIIGTGTALADNPSLTARKLDGSLYGNQPRRVVVGTREVPEGNLTQLGYEQYSTLDEALRALYDTGARDVLVEGGAGLLTSVLEADLADRIQAYLAPMLMGGGNGVVMRPLAETLASMPRFALENVQQLGEDLLINLKRKQN